MVWLGGKQRWLAFLALNLRDIKYTQSELRSGYSAYSLVTPYLASISSSKASLRIVLGRYCSL